MEQTKAELARIVEYPNPYYWAAVISVEEEAFADHCYYFLDHRQHGVNGRGDTALHRLLALDASPSVVCNFLEHARRHEEHWQKRPDNNDLGPYTGLPPPPLVSQANDAGVTALHVVVYRNSRHAPELVKLLLHHEPRLASTPTMGGAGWYPLHVLCATTPTTTTVGDLLLQHAPKVVLEKDADGNNPLALLWKTTLRSARWARQWDTAAAEGVWDVPKLAADRLSYNNHNVDTHKRRRSVNQQYDRSIQNSWMTTLSPHEYLSFSLSMIQAAQCALNHSNGGDRPLTWHDICSFPQCPPLLLRILMWVVAHEQQQQHDISNDSKAMPSTESLFLSSKPFTARDTQGRLPLHCAAASEPVNRHSHISPVVARRIPTLVQLLLQMDGRAAAVQDEQGCYPLHYACSTQQSDDMTLRQLMWAAPQALRVPCPRTGLFPAFLVARQADRGCHTIQKDDDNDDNDNETKGQNGVLTLLYEMLLACPETVSLSSEKQQHWKPQTKR